MTAKYNSGATKKAKRRTPNKKSEATDAQFSKKAGKSFLITLAIGAILLLVAALALCFVSDPAPLIRPVGVMIAALTALAGGFAAGRLHGHAPAACGLLNGALLMALMLILSPIFRSHAAGYSVWISLALHAVIPLLSLAGATLGMRKKPAPKHRRKRK